MNRKLIAAIGAAALLGLTACGSDGNDGSTGSDAAPEDRSETLTVWLMGEADSTWPHLVEQVNEQFAETYPNVKVNVQYQQWGDKTTKLDAALGGDQFPDIVELGNTETMQYILNGALAEIDPADYENSDTWLEGLETACTADGTQWCVPYYAGSRLGIYNAEMFEQATGSAELPQTEEELREALDALAEEFGSDDSFSALYLPGRYWYAAMSYVSAYGGAIAEFDEDAGEWRAALSTPEAQQGIEHFTELVKTYNNGDQTKDEQDHGQVMANEKSALIYGPSWEAGVIVSEENEGNPELDGKIAVAPMPGPDGQVLPTFIGGSTLGIIGKSKVQDLATDWIALFTSAESMEVLAETSTLPNNTAQLELLSGNPDMAASAAALESSWFTPIAPGWATIEQQGVLQNMLLEVLRGTPVEEATAEADQKIDELINSDV
ncbi:extracellular solute-binding protein [Streptomyces sodiiphilus]|uniref:Extracellular solute-binding protein n=1 Tax=Streptomyces sodiiphilus TaxID=226217 RepID=A0ABN2NSL5_9ACTN